MARYDTGVRYDSGARYDEPDPVPKPPARMSKPKLELQKKKKTELATFIQNIVTNMTGNPHFTAPNPTPSPALATVTAAVTAYSAALADAELKKTAALLATSALNTAKRNLETLATALASYVEGRALGDEGIILSSGMPTRSIGSPNGLLPAPDDLSATAGDNEGEVDLTWDPEDGAVSYEIECKTHTDASVWEKVKTVTASKLTVTALTPGLPYAFRVRAINAAGPGAWSDEAVRRAP